MTFIEKNLKNILWKSYLKEESPVRVPECGEFRLFVFLGGDSIPLPFFNPKHSSFQQCNQQILKFSNHLWAGKAIIWK